MLEDFKYVADNSKYIKLDLDKITNLINDLGNLDYEHWSREFNLALNEKEWILLVFIVESMNFCFWKRPKWKIQYKDEIITGSNAMIYSVINQIEKDKSFLNIDYLANLTREDFDKIFIGVEEVCPHLDKRFENFKETITYIKNHDFYNELFNIKSDLELLNYIINNFKHFDDKSLYKGRVIHFNKRATLLTNDLYYVSNTIKNNIKDVDNLTGCADYVIPRTFRDYNIMVYNDDLANTIDNEIEIPHDSDMEIEIRGVMLYIIELIKTKLADQGIIINSIELDSLIWNLGRKTKKSLSHRTVTIYY